MIFSSVNSLMNEIAYLEWRDIMAKQISGEERHRLHIVATSCPGDPLHQGHIACLNACKEYAASYTKGILVVIVNSDEFLIRKKGYRLLPLQTRMAVINNLKCEPWVVPWDDGSQNVAGALKIIEPEMFCKGGDRTPTTMDRQEIKVCEEIHCEIKYGVGGTNKMASSSNFVEDAFRQWSRHNLSRKTSV